jgi:hypothetical protein
VPYLIFKKIVLAVLAAPIFLATLPIAVPVGGVLAFACVSFSVRRRAPSARLRASLLRRQHNGVLGARDPTRAACGRANSAPFASTLLCLRLLPSHQSSRPALPNLNPVLKSRS